MRRVQSESRQPGMHGGRHCLECGETLEVHEFERCTTCRPGLSERARAAGEVRKRELQEIAEAERQIENLQGLIKKLHRRVT